MKLLLNATDGPLSLRAIRRYVLEMTAGLGAPASGVDLHLLFLTHRVGRVARFLRQLPATTRYRVHLFPVPRAWLYRRYAHPRRELLRLARRMDVYHETTTDSPALPGVPVLTTVHGCAPLVRPDLLPAAFVADKCAWFERAARHSDAFAAVSETSRGEFLERFPVDPARVRAIPLGVSAIFSTLPAAQALHAAVQHFGLRDPYVLYVGGIQRNKNIELVLEVYRRLRTEHGFSGPLVLAGDLHYAPEEFARLLARHRLAAHVRLVGCLPPEDPRLAVLYRGAALFLFPSFYEGWTSPPLEAMACGAPVIASSASSIPETVGGGGRTADPTDPDAWLAHAVELLTDRAARTRQIEAGVARAAEFPWSRTVGDTVRFYRDLIAGRLTSARGMQPGSPLEKSFHASG